MAGRTVNIVKKDQYDSRRPIACTDSDFLLIMFMFFQRQIVSGMTTGAIKG